MPLVGIGESMSKWLLPPGTTSGFFLRHGKESPYTTLLIYHVNLFMYELVLSHECYIPKHKPLQLLIKQLYRCCRHLDNSSSTCVEHSSVVFPSTVSAAARLSGLLNNFSMVVAAPVTAKESWHNYLWIWAPSQNIAVWWPKSCTEGLLIGQCTQSVNKIPHGQHKHTIQWYVLQVHHSSKRLSI